MKKMFMFAALFAAFSLVACGGEQPKQTEEAEDAIEEALDYADEVAEEAETPAEQTARKSGEQTDEAPDNPNPGDYSVTEEHEVTFGVSESSEDELEIMRRFMKKDE